MDITEFLKARLDEDEAAAAAASDGPWVPWRGRPGLGLRHLEYGVMLPGQGAGSLAAIAAASRADAEHIARHDPARVLREVEAKRAILAEHRSLGGMFPNCSACARWAPGSYHGVEEEWEEPPDDMSRVGFSCRTVRLLAAAWSDHADYDSSWKP